MANIFDENIDCSELSRKKWEYEINRTGYQDLISFGTADMDYRSPQPILDAIIKVAKIGHLGYPSIKDSYYAAIENWMKRTMGWEIDAKACTSPHVGIYMSCITAMDALSDPGDEIIIQTPVHTRFTQLIQDNGRVPVFNQLVLKDGSYYMDYVKLEALITNKTKILWLCNPHNPVGRAWTTEELKKLGDICLNHGIYILSDDVYCGMPYPGHKYTAIASLSKELSDIAITCYSPSKCYNTTGINSSFVVIENPDIMQTYRKSLHKTDLDYALGIVGLAITESAYDECDSWLAEFMEHIQENHKFLAEFVSENMPGVYVTSADSTYFGWLDMTCLHKPSAELVQMFEKEAHVVVNDGAALGLGGEGFIRMNLACPRDVLQEGLIRIQQAYKKML